MEIKYLKKMQKTPVIDGEENEGVIESEIDKLEKQIGKVFPIAFKEFLFLGGNRANMLIDMDNGLFYQDKSPHWKEMQENSKTEMAEMGIKPDKDFWVFASLDGGEQCHLFYFDDGDDPQVYYYCSYHDNEDFTEEYAAIEKMNYSFSEYINEQIDDAKKNGWG